MKFCPNCGTKLEDEVRFCPECGSKAGDPVRPEQAAPAAAAAAPAPAEQKAPAAPAEEPAYSAPVSSEPAPKKKKKGKAGVVIAVILALLIAACAALYFTGLYKKLLPASRLKLGLAEKDNVDRILDEAFNEPVVEVPESVKAKANVSVDLDLSGSLDPESMLIQSIIKKLVLEIGIDAKTDDHSFIDLGVIYMGNKLLSGTAFIKEDKIGVYAPALDEHYYTMTPEALMKLFTEKETEGEDSSSSLSDIDLTPFDEAKTRKEIDQLLVIIGKISTKENTQIDKNVGVQLFAGEEKVTADRYVITPSEKELEKMYNDIADFLARKDSYLGERLGGIYAAYAASYNKSIDEMNEWAREWAEPGEDVELQEKIPETLPEYLKANAAEAAKSLADAHAKFKVYLDGVTPVSHRVETDTATFIFDELETKNEKRSFFSAYALPSEEDGVVTDFSFDLKKDTSKATRLKGSAVIKNSEYYGSEFIEDSNFELTFDFNRLKKSSLGTMEGEAALKADGKEVAKLTVTDIGSGMQHVLFITGGSDDEEIDIGTSLKAITITAVVTDGEAIEEPKGVTPTDISNYSEEQIQEILEGVGEQLSEILGSIFMGGF